ncbi:aldehyde dehydrogenase [Pseudomonas cremoricolorata]|uniref:Aldehyde dehydrogenase n=1 Tax=Pseudomonas cremoricolorata TaxID=157783 RepID=A0A089WSM0_9PSED|nr:PA2169 family four-helix-bundle protein [Pseudomonas cremoricolorata]AIR89522.1 aldehyde dehydrogenase [Pseudomonas cremoricolorata]
MSNPNKDVIDVLNDLIEYSKDGEKGFKESADDVKHPDLKRFFAERAAACATAVHELQAEVRHLGGEPKDSTSISGDLHRGWVNFKSIVTGKDEEAVLNEVERGEDHALKAYKDAREKLVKLGANTNHAAPLGTTGHAAPLGTTTTAPADAITGSVADNATRAFILVQEQLDGVQRNHDQVKALRDQARARS